MKNKTITSSKPTEFLSTLTRDELRALASRVSVPRGKDRVDTIINLTDAIVAGKVMVKNVVTVYIPPTPENPWRQTVFVKKLRTYKEDKTLVCPTQIPAAKS